jgi:BirA family biotin operon repressor/biotin-[acetyl-CoA-carboxylase] ligase
MTIGTDILRFESLPSTNDKARELARAGAAHGTVVVADEQTRGRGTKGRSWHSPRGLGLYASFILRSDGPGALRAPFSLLPLAAGLAAAEALRDAAGLEAKLKWPNDLVFGRRKIGGILTEAVLAPGRPGFAVVGVGLNVNHVEADFPEGMRGAATSIRLATGREADREALLASLCPGLERWYNPLVRGDGAAVLAAYQARMAFPPGTRLRVSGARGEMSGLFRGLEPDGRLRLEPDGGLASLAFEDVLALDWE